MNLTLFASPTLCFLASHPASPLVRQAPVPVELQGRQGGIPVQHPELLSGLSVGRVVAKPRWKLFPDGMDRVVQRVRVDDSRAFKAGTEVEIVLTTPNAGIRPAVDPKTALPIGKEVLVIGPASSEGAIAVTSISGSGVDRDGTIQVGETPSVLALAFFQTSRTTLPPIADPGGRYLTSLAEAVPNTGDANVAEIADFLKSIRLPEWKADWPFGHDEDLLSRSFAANAAKATAFQRAQIFYSLNYLYYIGYSDKYEHAVIESAGEPNAFPRRIPEPSWWEDTVNNPRIRGKFEHAPFDEALAVTAILQGKNSRVRTYLINRIPYQKLEGAKRFLPVLDDADPEVRWTLVHSLVLWLQQGPAPEAVVRKQMPDGTEKAEYPGLSITVDSWKARLKAASN